MGQDWSELKHVVARSKTSLLFFVLIFFAPCIALAQSGRGPKAGNPPPTKPPNAEPAAKAPMRGPERPALSLIAADYVPSANVAVATGIAYRSFVERLKESQRLTVRVEKALRRKDAIALAKSETDTYVVWFELELDLGPGDLEKGAEQAAILPLNLRCLLVTYAVFWPGTGKVKTQGRVYQPGYQSTCVGGVYHPSPYPDARQPRRLPAETTLEQAGRDAADRLMTAFDLPVPQRILSR